MTMIKRFYKGQKRRGMAALLAGILALGSMSGEGVLPSLFGAVPAKAAETAATGIHVDYHTQGEICQYIREQGITLDSLTRYGSPKTTYEEEPSVTAPYAAGKMSAESAEYARNVLNSVRYIAGISEVQLKDEYQEKVQAAAVVNAANNSLSHSPSQPEGMEDALYQLGYEGAGRANLSTGSWDGTLAYHIVHSWMEDSDSSNIDRVGHRRWILNPAMQYTGFGQAKGTGGWSYYAMYAFDNAFGATEDYGVAWPAQTMPVEYFDAGSAWSISMGNAVDQSAVTVKLTSLTDGRSWSFSDSSADGDFYVSNENYGKQGCIIFRPSTLTSYADGDSFQVEITGLEETVSYQVDFFSLEETVVSPSPSAVPGVVSSESPSVAVSTQPDGTAAPYTSTPPDSQTSQTPSSGDPARETPSVVPGVVSSESPSVTASAQPDGTAAPYTSTPPDSQTSQTPSSGDPVRETPSAVPGVVSSESPSVTASAQPDGTAAPYISTPPSSQASQTPSSTVPAAGATKRPAASPAGSVGSQTVGSTTPSAAPSEAPETSADQSKKQTPAKAKVVSVKNKNNKKLVVKVKAQKNCTGYQLRYGIGKSMKKGKKVSGKKPSFVLKGFQKNKVYYIRVRAYRTVNGVRRYGAWSNPVKIKIFRKTYPAAYAV